MVGSSTLGELGVNGCASQAGFYYLPKQQILIEVKRSKSGSGSDAKLLHKIELQSRSVPDKRFGYCLDYLWSATSDDIVEVKKHPKTPILALITTDALDQSKFILQSLIRALFVAISGDPNFPGAGRAFLDENKVATVFRGELDPFDPVHSAVVNDALKDFGFCLVLQGNFMFDTRRSDIDEYCDEPQGTWRHQQLKMPEYGHRYQPPPSFAVPESTRGIFYRPRIPHQVHVYVKENAMVPGGWRLRVVRTLEMENIAPVVGVGIERAAFTQRKTTLVFDAGVLKSVCIYKKSELLEFVQIPLYVVQSVVLLPTRIIMVRIDQTNSQRAIVQAEDELIKAQLHYLNVLQDPEYKGQLEATKVPSKKQPTEGERRNEEASRVPPVREAFPKYAQDAFTDICPTTAKPPEIGFVPLFTPATAGAPVVGSGGQGNATQ